MGVSVSGVNAPQISNRVPESTEIEKIQALLNKRGYAIPVTGKIDEATMSALESLEHEYPVEETGKDITGSFVNRQTGRIIPYNDLINALNMLEK